MSKIMKKASLLTSSSPSSASSSFKKFFAVFSKYISTPALFLVLIAFYRTYQVQQARLKTARKQTHNLSVDFTREANAIGSLHHNNMQTVTNLTQQLKASQNELKQQALKHEEKIQIITEQLKQNHQQQLHKQSMMNKISNKAHVQHIEALKHQLLAQQNEIKENSNIEEQKKNNELKSQIKTLQVELTKQTKEIQRLNERENSITQVAKVTQNTAPAQSVEAEAKTKALVKQLNVKIQTAENQVRHLKDVNKDLNGRLQKTTAKRLDKRTIDTCKAQLKDLREVNKTLKSRVTARGFVDVLEERQRELESSEAVEHELEVEVEMKRGQVQVKSIPNNSSAHIDSFSVSSGSSTVINTIAPEPSSSPSISSNHNNTTGKHTSSSSSSSSSPAHETSRDQPIPLTWAQRQASLQTTHQNNKTRSPRITGKPGKPNHDTAVKKKNLNNISSLQPVVAEPPKAVPNVSNTVTGPMTHAQSSSPKPKFEVKSATASAASTSQGHGVNKQGQQKQTNNSAPNTSKSTHKKRRKRHKKAVH